MLLDPINSALDTLNKLADLTKTLQEIAMNFSLPDEVKKINQKLDQDITKKIKSGFESIRLASRNRDEKAREQDLEDARNDLRDLIGLTKELDTQGIPNGDVIAIANYGLTIIHNMKNNRERAAYHLFKAFEEGPRKARQIAPEMYASLFKSTCGDPYIIPPMQINSSEDDFLRGAAEFGRGAAKLGLLALGAAITLGSLGRVNPGSVIQPLAAGLNATDNISADPLIAAREAQRRAELMEAYQKKLDDCCRKTAGAYLIQLNY